MDIADPRGVCDSPSEMFTQEEEKEAGDVNSTVAENGDHRKEAAADVSPSCSDPHPSPSSTDQTFTVTASVPDDEPNSSSETGTGPEVKTEETDKENVSVTDENNSEGEDTDMDKTSDAQKDLKENAAPRSCTLRVSTADDLDEMMDIGTVDQIDQEAQMEKEEGWETPRDVQRTPSSGSSPTGNTKQKWICVTFFEGGFEGSGLYRDAVFLLL